MGVARRSLLDQLVDDPKSRLILHQFLHKARGRKKLIYPQTLSSGPGGLSGITNQIMALVGYCVLANLTNASLVLPHWDTHIAGAAKRLAFDELFDIGHFVHTMKSAHALRQGIVYISSDQERRAPLMDNRTIVVRRSFLGWRIYKAIHARAWQRRLNASTIAADVIGANGPITSASPSLRIIELAVYRALRASPRVRKAAELTMAAMTTPRRYGCIHARVETDMQQWWRRNLAGPPPALARYLGHAAPGASGAPSLAVFPEVLSSRQVFVSVGVDIVPADAEMLRTATAWGAPIIRTSAAAKTSYNASATPASFARAPLGGVSQAAAGIGPSAQAHPHPYALAALIDMEICRGADWFAGWPGSTFARLLGALRAIDHAEDPGYFAVCPEFVVRFRPHSAANDSGDADKDNNFDFIGHHELCSSAISATASRRTTTAETARGHKLSPSMLPWTQGAAAPETRRVKQLKTIARKQHSIRDHAIHS